MQIIDGLGGSLECERLQLLLCHSGDDLVLVILEVRFVAAVDQASAQREAVGVVQCGGLGDLLGGELHLNEITVFFRFFLANIGQFYKIRGERR